MFIVAVLVAGSVHAQIDLAGTPIVCNEDQVWSATMTVGSNGDLLGYSTSRERTAGILSDDSFLWRGETYVVANLAYNRSRGNAETWDVLIDIAPAFPGGVECLTLQLGETWLNFSDARGNHRQFFWTDVGLNWSIGTNIAVGVREFPPAFEPRSIDGWGNNPNQPEFGMADSKLLRRAPVSYEYGASAELPADLPGARVVSNALSAQSESVLNSAQATDMVWQWGQFLDHDISLTPVGDPPEPLPIPIPRGDLVFDPFRNGARTMPFNRSAFDPNTGTGLANPREQVNKITAFIDASNVYGSDGHRTRALRANDGTGKLKTSAGGRFLPYNENGLDNDGGSERRDLFVAGDIRANEQVGLTALHTLFLREHNRLAEAIASENPGLTGHEIFETARKMVGAQMQVITYNEFLPLLLGADALPPYTGYDSAIDPTIDNEFSTAAYRFGHTMLSPSLLRIDTFGAERPLSLRDAFFNPSQMTEQNMSGLLRGLSKQHAQEIDSLLVDEVRNMLFGEPGGPGRDLAALNIQRSRDHGIPSYNMVRSAYGLSPAQNFEGVSSNPYVQAALIRAYGDVALLDLWSGGLSEDHLPGAMVGETFHTIITDQFRRLRDGDRYWYESDPYFLANPDILIGLQTTTLADIIRRNTSVGDEIPDAVFGGPPHAIPDAIAVNQPPAAEPDAINVDEGDAVTVAAAWLLRNDTDAEDDELTVTGVSDPINGSVTLQGATVTYQHDGSETTMGGFKYAVSDGPEFVTAPVTVTVNAVNDSPRAAPDTVEVDEGDAVTVEMAWLLRNDTDAEGDDLAVTQVGNPVNGRVTWGSTAVTYQHDGFETTTGGFSYTVSDGSESVTALVTVTVNAVNDSPRAAPDAINVDEGDAVTVAAAWLLRNDTDAEDDDLGVARVSDPVNGTVTLEDTTVTYQHDGSETATGSFTYTVSDGESEYTAQVTIDVMPVNDPPLAAADTVEVYEGDEVSMGVVDLLTNDSDPEGELAVIRVGEPVNGSVRLDSSTVTYRHNGSETAVGSFIYTVSDGEFEHTAQVTIDVLPINDPPVASPDTAEVHEGDTVTMETVSLLRNDTDPEGDALVVTGVGNPLKGNVKLDRGEITYSHDGSEPTISGFTYTVSDGVDTDMAQVRVDVLPVNDPPLAAPETTAVNEGGEVSLRVTRLLSNDVDPEGDALTITEVGDAINGSVRLEGSTVMYLHNGSETTGGGFTYTVSDGADTATGQVTVMVTPVNDPPLAVMDRFAIDEGDTLSLNVSELLANDSDVDSGALRLLEVHDGVNGRVQLQGTVIAYEHDGSETPTGGFTYTITDGSARNTAKVLVDVTSPSNSLVMLWIGLAIGGSLLMIGLLGTLLLIKVRWTRQQ